MILSMQNARNVSENGLSKKMMKLEKKLKRYAKIYFGQDMLIIYKNPEAFKEAIKSGKVSVEINEKARPL